MKKYCAVLIIDNIFDSCKQWSSNRVFVSQNPNLSQTDTNNAYAMTDDDKEQFFMDYLKNTLSELMTDGSLHKILKYNRISFDNDTYFVNDNIISINFVAGEYFPMNDFKNILSKLLQWAVLYYWYWEKCMIEEYAQMVKMQLDSTKNKLHALIDKDYDAKIDSNNYHIPYNDGFTLCYQPKNKIPLISDQTITDDILSPNDIVCQDNIVIRRGEHFNLSYEFVPCYAIDEVEYINPNTDYYIVENNTLIGLQPTTGRIMQLHAIRTNILKDIGVEVIDTNIPLSFNLNADSISIYVNETFLLQPTFEPINMQDALDYHIVPNAQGQNDISIDSTGLITGLNPTQNCILKVSMHNRPHIYKTISVEVKPIQQTNNRIFTEQFNNIFN